MIGSSLACNTREIPSEFHGGLHGIPSSEHDGMLGQTRNICGGGREGEEAGREEGGREEGRREEGLWVRRPPLGSTAFQRTDDGRLERLP